MEKLRRSPCSAHFGLRNDIKKCDIANVLANDWFMHAGSHILYDCIQLLCPDKIGLWQDKT